MSPNSGHQHIKFLVFSRRIIEEHVVKPNAELTHQNLRQLLNNRSYCHRPNHSRGQDGGLRVPLWTAEMYMQDHALDNHYSPG
jgi:hypothetical protein